VHDEPGVLVLWLSGEAEKADLIASAPATFFDTPHYAGSSLVLVRLEEDELNELLTDAWRSRAPRRIVEVWEAPPES